MLEEEKSKIEEEKKDIEQGKDNIQINLEEKEDEYFLGYKEIKNKDDII